MKEWKNVFLFLLVLLLAAPLFSAPVPDTGQTKYYNDSVEIPCPSPGEDYYGQDANYTINPMSYTKLDSTGNALSDSATSWDMVRDNVTGLIWEVKTSKDRTQNYNDPHDADNTYTWYDSNPATNGGYSGKPGDDTDTEDFIKALNDANYGGFSDWRMPTLMELATIVRYDIPFPGPTIHQNYFPNNQTWYCSSTTEAFYRSNAWGVDFYGGGGGGGNKGYRSYVRAVRGGQSGSLGQSVIGALENGTSREIEADTVTASSYTDNKDGTVTDTSTGLMWQQTGFKTMLTWRQALTYCENLDLGGYSDWRLPTITDLYSIVDYSRYDPAINTDFFYDDTKMSWYWSSTTCANDTSSAWVMYFYDGRDSGSSKNYNFIYVRAVRGGQSGALDNLVLSVTPANQHVGRGSGTTSFSVSNTGSGTMNWSASVTSGSSWLSITSGSSGTNSGTITCSYTADTNSSSRTGTIRVTAPGAAGSPMDVTVSQQITDTDDCTSTIDSNLVLHIPYATYIHPSLGPLYFYTHMIYELDLYDIIFKLTTLEVYAETPPYSCTPATLSSCYDLHVPDVLLPDGITHIWLDLSLDTTRSTEYIYFVITNYGELGN